MRADERASGETRENWYAGDRNSTRDWPGQAQHPGAKPDCLVIKNIFDFVA